MMLKPAFTLFMVLLLSGCAQFPERVNTGDESLEAFSPALVAAEADALALEGYWSEALDLLARAQTRYTDSPVLQKKAWDLMERWEEFKQTVEHRILIAEAGSVVTRLEMIRRLERGDPANYTHKTRKLFWQQALKNKREQLLLCSDYQLKREFELARECVELAAYLGQNQGVEQRLAAVELRQLEIESRFRKEVVVKGVRSKVRHQPVRTADSNRSGETPLEERAVDRTQEVLDYLVLARGGVEVGDFLSARSNLKSAMAIQPESQAHWNQIETLQQRLDEQVEALTLLGERYYSQDELELAVSTWEEVLLLDPERSDITERINRARRILVRYELIKQQSTDK